MVKPGRLPCGHPIGWIFRLRDGDIREKYCLGCLVRKIGLKQVGEEEVKEEKPKTKSKKSKKDEDV